jgi:hypothetical protein
MIDLPYPEDLSGLAEINREEKIEASNCPKTDP